MKIQCSCGSKYNIDVTPEMAQGPVHFVCSSCGLDASEYVTTLVHRELAFAGVPTPAAAVPVATALPVAVAAPATEPAPAASPAPGRLRVHVSAPAKPQPAEEQ